LLKLKDGQLKLAHIDVIYDSEAASRELIAIKEFSNVGDKNSRLDPTRQALISNPASRVFTHKRTPCSIREGLPEMGNDNRQQAATRRIRRAKESA